MYQKRNKRITYIVFALGMFVLTGLLVLLCFPRTNREKAVETEEMPVVVFEGMELNIPQGYRCFPDENSGLVLYQEESVLWLSVQEGAYGELQEEREGLISQAEEKGYTCIAPIQEYQSDTRSYLYFIIENDGRTQYIIYSSAGANSYFGIIVDAPGQTAEGVMGLTDAVIGSAQETERENTSIYDLLLIHPESVEHMYIPEGALLDEQGNTLVSFQIPEGFYVDGGGNAEIIGDYQSFTSYDTGIFVSVSLVEPEWGLDAEDYIREEALMFASTDLCINQTVVNGGTVYYFSENHAEIYEEVQEQFYNFYAFIDLKNGRLYKVKGFSLSNPQALELETYQSFLEIEYD